MKRAYTSLSNIFMILSRSWLSQFLYRGSTEQAFLWQIMNKQTSILHLIAKDVFILIILNFFDVYMRVSKNPKIGNWAEFFTSLWLKGTCKCRAKWEESLSSLIQLNNFYFANHPSLEFYPPNLAAHKQPLSSKWVDVSNAHRHFLSILMLLFPRLYHINNTNSLSHHPIYNLSYNS